MPKLSPEDLDRISARVRKTTLLREGAGRARIVVHMGTCGIAAGARAIMTAVTKALAERNLTDVLVTSSGCAGLCSREPMMTVEIKGEAPVKYASLDADKATRIIEEHVQGGKMVESCVLGKGCERLS